MKESFTLGIPTSLNHITLGQYQEYLKILEVNKENQTSDFVLIKTVEIFCNSTTKDVSSISLNDLYEIHSHLMGLFDLHTPLIRKFTLKDLNDKHVTFAFVPKLEDITMGEFVDLDTNITDMSKLHNAMAVLYRPLLFERKNFYSIKPYNGYEETAPIFKYMPLDVALGAMVFLSFRKRTTELFEELFNGTSSDGGTTASDGFGRKWGWYQSIYALARGDVSRFDKITSLPHQKCLLWLEFEKEKTQLEIKMIKRK